MGIPVSLKRLVAFAPSLLILLPLAFDPADVEGQRPNRGKLGKRDRELLAESRARGEQFVVLLIASEPGANNRVAADVTNLGGRSGSATTRLTTSPRARRSPRWRQSPHWPAFRR